MIDVDKLARWMDHAGLPGKGEPMAYRFIAGGSQIFEQTLHRADRMYLTRVHTEIEGDAFFPEFDDVTEWILIDSEHCEADEKNEFPYSFLTYERAAKLA